MASQQGDGTAEFPIVLSSSWTPSSPAAQAMSVPHPLEIHTPDTSNTPDTPDTPGSSSSSHVGHAPSATEVATPPLPAPQPSSAPVPVYPVPQLSRGPDVLSSAPPQDSYMEYTVPQNLSRAVQLPTNLPSAPQAAQAPRGPSQQGFENVVLPRWQPDSEATHCPICHAQFNVLYRKHHCRKCGRVVCGKCSPHRITIPFQYIVLPPNVGAQQAAAAMGAYNGHSGGGVSVRLCNPCVPDPNTAAPFSAASAGGPSYNTRSMGGVSWSDPYGPGGRRSSQLLPQPVQQQPGFFPNADVRQPFQLPSPRPGYLPNFGFQAGYLPSFPSPFGGTFGSAPGPQNYVQPGGPSYSYSGNLPTINDLDLHRSTRVARRASALSDVMGEARRRTDSNSSGSSRARGRTDLSPEASTRFQEQFVVNLNSLRNVQLQEQQRAREAEPAPVPIREEDECPVCRRELPKASLPDAETLRENHISQCIEAYSSRNNRGSHSSPSVAPSGSDPANRTAQRQPSSSPPLPPPLPRLTGMFPYRATEKDCADAAECTICLEEFVVGVPMARLECFCRYHEQCIQAWFEAHPGRCPVHQHDGFGF